MCDKGHIQALNPLDPAMNGHIVTDAQLGQAQVGRTVHIAGIHRAVGIAHSLVVALCIDSLAVDDHSAVVTGILGGLTGSVVVEDGLGLAHDDAAIAVGKQGRQGHTLEIDRVAPRQVVLGSGLASIDVISIIVGIGLDALALGIDVDGAMLIGLERGDIDIAERAALGQANLVARGAAHVEFVKVVNLAVDGVAPVLKQLLHLVLVMRPC